MKRKLALAVVLIVLIGGVAAALWRPWEQPARPPEQPAETPPAPRPDPRTTAEEEPEVAWTPLPELGCRLAVATGWEVGTPSPETAIIPGDGPLAVLEKRAAGRLPLLLIGRIPPSTLGDGDPQAYPAAFVTSLRERLAEIVPTPTVDPNPAPPDAPSLFEAGAGLLAKGAFPDMGVPDGTGRFMAGTTAAGKVYVIVAFAGDEATEQEILAMVRSLAPLAEAGEADAAE